MSMADIKKKARELSMGSRLAARLGAEYIYRRNVRDEKRCGKKHFETIDSFLSDEQKEDRDYLRRIRKDVLFSHLRYRISYSEYFWFGFENLSDTGRKKYIGHEEAIEIYRRLNSSGKPEIFEDKYKTYEAFRPFYGREVLLIRDRSQREEFLAFLERHPLSVKKPLGDFGGKGVCLLSAPDRETAERLFETLGGTFPLLLEERIIQDPRMAVFHPQSVNTIRYTSFFHEGKLTKLQAVLRMGRGESFADNASLGGIYALIDTESGIVKNTARSDRGEEYLFHPTTGEQILGRRIPRWDELNALLEQVVRIIPEQKQVGWDFALSTDGWVLVEGNTNIGVQWFDFDHGLRDELMPLYLGS